jgi:microcystin-dependent protein
MLKKSFHIRSVKSINTLLSASALVLATGFSQPALAFEPFLGEIETFGFNFAPRGWAFCDGQILPINQNQALFSLLGTTYGGDGRTTFALPDLRGRVALHPGNGPGLSSIRQGEKGGSETRTLTTANLPSHNHAATLNATNERGNSEYPNDLVDGENPGDPQIEFRNVLASKARTKIYKVEPPQVDATSPPPIVTVPMSPKSITVANTGGGQSFSIRDPFLGIYHSIALVGVFPSRN